jgi:GMP synthase-like glutamine amidotransferase
VLVVQHEVDEGAGVLGDVLARRGVATRVIHTHAGDAVPASLDEVGASALVVLGGGMAVYDADRHPHVRDELRLIERTVANRSPVLGICFGSQLLASALGARVYATGREEIGWFEVTLEDAATNDALFADAPRAFTPFHWHGDTFDLPTGATLLARSRTTSHQAYRFGARVWGIQFHPEVTLPIVESMVRSDEAERAGLDAVALLERARTELPRIHPTATRIFDRFVDALAIL